MSKSDPSVNPNAKQDDDKGEESQSGHDDSLRHRSINSQIKGGQNQEEGEPHPGYGSDQAQSQRGNNDQ